MMHQQTMTLLHWKIVLDDIDGLTVIEVRRGSVSTGFPTGVFNVARREGWGALQNLMGRA